MRTELAGWHDDSNGLCASCEEIRYMSGGDGSVADSQDRGEDECPHEGGMRAPERCPCWCHADSRGA